MKSFLRTKAGYATVAVLALLLILIATNPSQASHEAAIRKLLKQEHPVAEGWLGLGKLWTSLLTYDSYLVASRMTYEKKTVSFGVLGYVHVSEVPK